MSHKSTLLAEADVTTYINSVLQQHREPSKRREVIAYLQSIVEKDKGTLSTYHTNHKIAKDLVKKYADSEDIHGAAQTTHLFVADAQTQAQLIARLSVDDGIVYGNNYTFENISGTFFDVTGGDDTQFIGESNGLSAKTKALVCTCIVKAPLRLGGAENCVIDGVKFQPVSGENTISFSASTQDITFKNCIFDGSGHAASVLIIGENATGYMQRDITFDNCIFQNYKSWMLGDINTESNGNPASTLRNVVIKNCGFFDCMGSFAVRGQPGNTNSLSCTFQNNLISVSGLADVHSVFWSAFECNNFQTVVCKDNVASCFRKVGGSRGFFQAFSKSDDQWTLEISNNKISNFNVGYQIPFYNEGSVSIFYGVASGSIVIGDNDLFSVDNAVSLQYPFDSTSEVTGPISGAIPSITKPAGAHVVPTSAWVDYTA